MKLLKYLNPYHYDYNDRHKNELILKDSNTIRILFCVLLTVMSLTFLLTVLRPELRYDSGMDNWPHLIVAIAGSIIGIFLTSIKIKNEKWLIMERKFVRLYISVLFLYLSLNQIILSDAKCDGVFTFFMYCAIVVNILHINPILFAVQAFLFVVFSAPLMFQYFDNSIGSMISFVSYVGGICFLSFYSSVSVHKKLSQIDQSSDIRKQLEKELQAKTAQVMDGIKREVEIQENVIFSIANLVESRDTDTGTHIKATAYYVEIILNNLKKKGQFREVLTDEFIHTVIHAAPMHDVGKIMIPDSILKAPRRLLDNEFEIMKTHTSEGARIVKHVYQGVESDVYIECAANIANYHHERWDGKGYPSGLSGNDIPLEARIMAVADVFDALVSKRCYKDAYPLSEAFENIEKNSGTQFDPVIVEAFLMSKEEIEQAVVNEKYE